MSTPTTGRESIFRGKQDGVRIVGVIRRSSSFVFEATRTKLAALAGRHGWRGQRPSDADVMEYLILGDAKTRAYLEGQQVVRRAKVE